MGLLGTAAMILSFDVVPEAIDEHDDWHTHEHFPERLAIPGFLRGTRWVADRANTRYVVLYEVEQLATLTSAAYLERLNNPTPWTAKMMPHYRGMTRGFCTIAGSFGAGLGQAALLIRFKPAEERTDSLREWLLSEALPQLPSMMGLASAHLFQSAVAPQGTSEQRIRGIDKGMDWAVLVTGYGVARVTDLIDTRLCEAQFQRKGATGYAGGIYRLEHSLTSAELEAASPVGAPASVAGRQSQ